MKFKQILAFTLALFFVMGIYEGKAQNNEVTGSVLDAQTEEPIPGANILIKGTNSGTSTDAEGNFALNVQSLSDTLVVSFIGYQKLEVPIDGRNNIGISLTPQTISGEEMVVVGYGTQTKENLTGSVTSVSSSDLENVSVANTSSMLQGRMSGVTVSNFASQPGRDDAQIRIRGVGTFNSGQNPLVVIDGVTSSIDEFSQIPASDIEDVTVLKDAASSAIYGSRAANGVVLVQTRQGTRQDPEITFRSTFTRQTPIIKPNLLESWEYAQVVNEWEVAEGGDPLYTDDMIQAMRDGSQPDRFANTDWFSEVINPSPMQEYYTSVSGGSESTQYMVSTEYKDQKGIMAGTGSEQISLRSNVNVDVGDKATVGLSLSGYREEITEPATVNASGGENSINYIVRRFAKPTIPVKYSNGEYGVVDGLYPEWGFPITNPVEAIDLGDQYENQYHVNAKLHGEINLLDNLSIRSHVSGIYNSSIWSSFSPTTQSYGPDGNVLSQNPTNSLANNNTTNYKILNENVITYEESVGNHNFSLLGGQSIEYYRNDYFYGYAEGFPNNNIHELGAGTENLDLDGSAQTYGLFSLFGRASYDYDSRYLFEANVRYDGSSRLPEDNRFDIFPSFSAGWVVSSEKFMQDIDYLSFLKFRASWGQLGNQEIGNYPYSQTYSTGQDYIIGGDLQGGAGITGLANSGISWETTTMTNLGLDLHFFESNLQLTADYFDKTSEDILLQLPIPANQGNVSSPYQNVGAVNNRGWELAVDYSKTLDNGFNFGAGFNVSKVTNEIEDLGELGDNELGGWISGNTVNVVGEPIGAYYGYEAEGYFQSQEEVDNHADQFGDLGPGDIKFKDQNGDGVIDADNDRTIIGDPFPDYTFGINLSAQFKRFDARAFLQGIYGIERFNYYNNELTAASGFTKSIMDRWSEDNRDAEFPRLGNWANNDAHSSYWLRDASYLRLKHLEFGYTLPSAITEKVSIKNLRLYVAGYNLATLTNLEEYDPEKATGDNRNQGYPGMKNYAFGISLKF